MTPKQQFRQASHVSRRTRKELLDPKSAYGIDSLRRGHLELAAALDSIAPGWKSVTVHSIYLADPCSKYWVGDNIYELPGRIFVRGWDTSGAINKQGERS